jgi:hypothetical protein
LPIGLIVLMVRPRFREAVEEEEEKEEEEVKGSTCFCIGFIERFGFEVRAEADV